MHLSTLPSAVAVPIHSTSRRRCWGHKINDGQSWGGGLTTHSACSSIQARSGYTPIHIYLAFETDDRYGKMYVWSVLVTIHH